MISKKDKLALFYIITETYITGIKGLLVVMLVTLTVFTSTNLKAQSNYPIRFLDSQTKSILKSTTNSSFDSLFVAQLAERAIIALWTKGYAEAGIDSTLKDSTQATFFLHRGTQFKTARFKLASPTNSTITTPNYIRLRRFGLLSLTASTDALLNACDNEGYPFATLQMDSVTIVGNKISGLLRLIPGTFVTFDTLIIKGDYRANRSYLDYLFGINRGDVYRERLVKQISSTVNRLEYITELRPAEAEFIPKKARVYAYLHQKRANQISALVAVAGKETGGIAVRGDLNLKLLNTLNVGEKIELRWKKLESNEQKLDAAATFPWLGLGGLGVASGLSIYRRDTTILVVNPKIGLTWTAPGGHQLQVFLEIRKVATNGKVSQVGYGASSATMFGLGYNFDRINAMLFPSSDIKVAVRASVGSRYADYPLDAQTSISHKSTSFGLSGKLGYYQSVVGRFGIFAGYTGGATGAFGGNGYNQLFYNELLQVGGYNSFRGFDEDFFWVSSYHIGTAEARYYFERESFVFLFVDKGYLERSYIAGFETFSPIGFGPGTQLAIGNSLFQLAYALGSDNAAAAKFKDAKVHFGYTARF